MHRDDLLLDLLSYQALFYMLIVNYPFTLGMCNWNRITDTLKKAELKICLKHHNVMAHNLMFSLLTRQLIKALVAASEPSLARGKFPDLSISSQKK